MSDIPKPLTAYDFNFHIQIKHGDRSTFDLAHACFKIDKDQIYVYTEHCGYFMFYKEDLELFRSRPMKFFHKSPDARRKYWTTLIENKDIRK